jgi:hypothetical protein
MRVFRRLYCRWMMRRIVVPAVLRMWTKTTGGSAAGA